jgi:hypothetical protein
MVLLSPPVNRDFKHLSDGCAKLTPLQKVLMGNKRSIRSGEDAKLPSVFKKNN